MTTPANTAEVSRSNAAALTDACGAGRGISGPFQLERARRRPGGPTRDLRLLAGVRPRSDEGCDRVQVLVGQDQPLRGLPDHPAGARRQPGQPRPRDPRRRLVVMVPADTSTQNPVGQLRPDRVAQSADPIAEETVEAVSLVAGVIGVAQRTGPLVRPPARPAVVPGGALEPLNVLDQDVQPRLS